MYESPAAQGLSPLAGYNANLVDVIARAIEPLECFGDDFVASCDELKILQKRLLSGRFHLAVLGQFKRGKSTLLNALLGEELLPADILPVTAIPTFIEYSPEITVRVHFESGGEAADYTASVDSSLAEFVVKYVTETGNPLNKLQVSKVEIGYPAEILKQGVVLVDTPGIGSTYQHNTEVAYKVLPQCDAAIFLVSPDPPITAVELDYLKEIKHTLPRTFFLLNKVDYLSPPETVASLSFLAEQLTHLCDGVPQVLPVSARQGLHARIANDSDGWANSGMLLVEQNLVDFFAREKQQILHQSLQNHTLDQLNVITMQVELALRALTLSADDLTLRIEQFKQSLPAIEREKHAAADILAGDFKRVVELLTREVNKLRGQAKDQIMGKLDALVNSAEAVEDIEYAVREVIAAEIPAFFSPAMHAVTATVRSSATELLELHQERSNKLIEQVRQTAAELFAIPYHAPVAVRSYTGFETSSWSNDLFISALDPLGQRLSRKLFTRKFRRKKTIKRLQENSLKLLNQNVEQIQWSLRRSVDENFRHFGAELSEQLDKTINATRQAMEIALQQSESQLNLTSNREVKLKKTLACLNDLSANLRG